VSRGDAPGSISPERGNRQRRGAKPGDGNEVTLRRPTLSADCSNAKAPTGRPRTAATKTRLLVIAAVFGDTSLASK
jgi:hypothetical protein